VTQLRHVDPLRPRGRVYRLLCRVSATPAGLWLSERVAWKLDPWLLRLSGGRLGFTGPLPSALLETRGARTGATRRAATLYFHDDDDVIVIASKRGAPEHPAWYRNLRRHPEVRFGGVAFRAETVQDPVERTRLWALADRVFPPFADYRAWAARGGREIPIVRLTPAGDGSRAPVRRRVRPWFHG
jgi:deazaflavin-dependent oxidoreductase (nitroreductase family)